ncbi:MAG: hypothetical protein NTV61_10755 [Candidatus Bathyarchaeota archaeon]|nr:hypothetical protein [Candidatus Bathyarchaeota archaeon]
MDTPRTGHVVEAAKELGESLKDAAGLVSGVSEAVHEMNKLYDHGYGGAGSNMISLGVALVMFPEPFMVSDVAGSGVIAAGLLYNKFVPPTLYVENIFETIQEQVKAIHSTREDLNQSLSIPIDFSSMRFEI